MGRMLVENKDEDKDEDWEERELEERELEEATRRSLDLHTDTQVG